MAAVPDSKRGKASSGNAGDSARSAWVSGAALLMLSVCSAFLVIHSTHDCRQLYARLQVLEASRWHLEEEYGRLLLEQSTWASHHRVEKVATDDLGMLPPGLAELRVVSP